MFRQVYTNESQRSYPLTFVLSALFFRFIPIQPFAEIVYDYSCCNQLRRGELTDFQAKFPPAKLPVNPVACAATEAGRQKPTQLPNRLLINLMKNLFTPSLKDYICRKPPRKYVVCILLCTLVCTD